MDWVPVGAIGGALWLGIQTSICPCPMATNIAAMSFISKRVGSPVAVVVTGLLYTLGRVLAYAGLGIVVVQGLLTIPGVSVFLQKYMGLLLGPILIIVGLVLLEAIRFPGLSLGGNGKLQQWAAKAGVLAPVLLGILFALSLCPVSAAFFFGSLVPLAYEYKSDLVLPSVYGIGTGLPVIGFAILLGFGAGSLGKVFQRLTQFEWWARRITGAIFILVGVYEGYANYDRYVNLFS